MINKAKKSYCEGETKFQILLTEYGFNIMKGDKKLLVEGHIHDVGYQNVALSERKLSKLYYQDPSCTAWIIHPREDNICRIEIPYGELRPRLMATQKDPILWSNTIVSNRERDGYNDSDMVLWRIDKV